MTQTPKVEKKEWILKEGRDKQWVSKGPWFGIGKEQTVVNAEYATALETAMKAANKIIKFADDFYTDPSPINMGDTRPMDLGRMCREYQDALAKVDLK